MIAVLRNQAYARLFSAQVIALLGTGLLTVALGLLAFEIAGTEAGAVLGVAMAIKMVAYVVVSPVANALTVRLPTKAVLIGADLVRAGVAVVLPWVSEAWQIYLLIFVLQSASATFTPTFQAVIPAVLPDEGDYTRALSLSRLAYDLEALVSPMLAALLLTVVSAHQLFGGTVLGFLASAMLVVGSRLPRRELPAQEGFIDRLAAGTRGFWLAPELRGLMALNLAVAAPAAMVIVNTVVLVQGQLGRSQRDVAILLAVYGGGSMLVALVLPRLLVRLQDRRVMLTGGLALPLLLMAASGVVALLAGRTQWVALLVVWILLGAATSAISTPTGRLLRRNSTEANRPAIFAAQFSFSHACFLLTYPLAGVLGAAIGLPWVGLILASLGVVGVVAAVLAWRRPVLAVH